MATIVNIESFEWWADGLDHPECVAADAEGNAYAGGEAGQIYRLSADGKFSEIASTGGFILGICLDADRNVYACDLKQHKVFRITQSGAMSEYSSGTEDRPMVTPNFPVFDAAGNLYVSDSGHWKKDTGCVYKISRDGVTSVWSTAPAKFANGMAMSADEKWLYVVLSVLPGVARIAINPDGSAGAMEEMVKLPGTVPDGLAFDCEGNLYISCYTPDVIYRLSPAGKLEEFARDPEHVTLSSPTNLAFCGEKLNKLVFASLGRWHLVRVEISPAGMKLNYPRV